MESIAASDDRVIVHQALKHLVTAGNALIFMSPKGLKLYPLNRYVVERDGNGNVIEIVTKERVSKKLVKKFFPDYKEPMPNPVGRDGPSSEYYDECDIYTHVIRDNNRVLWHQEVDNKLLPGSEGKAPIDSNPWIVMRFNHVDGEMYGRGRVEEFIGDFKSLEALSQALVEGSAAAAKVVFTVSPSSTTKPATLQNAGNGAIVQGRPDDIGVVQVGKTADFRTAYEMSMGLERRLADAFLIMQVRQSERTTAEEVRMTQMELERQLGGLFSLLTVEFLVPYLNRKLMALQKTGEIPRLPKKIVKPTIVAGINAIGRGQDAESLGQFLQIITQTMGPEAISTYINPEEVVKRLAAAQGIDVLNLVKSVQEVQAEQQASQEQQQEENDADPTSWSVCTSRTETRRKCHQSTWGEENSEAPKMATRKRRSSRKLTTEEPKRTEEVAENTLSKMEEKPAVEIKVETPEPNKYAPKKKVGTPTLGRSPNYVTSVGLGKLKVETANGYSDV